MNILTFTVASIVAVYLISIFLFRKGILNFFQRSIISLSLYVLFLGFSGLILIFFESYNLERIVFFLFLLSIILTTYFAITKTPLIFNPFNTSSRKIDWPTAIGVPLLLIPAIYLFSFFPTEEIRGNRDYGLYLDFGAQIARTGGMDFKDPFYQTLAKELEHSVVIGYPAIGQDFSDSNETPSGNLFPRFFPLYPSYLAIAFDLFGIQGALRINAIFGTLSVLFIFLITKKIIGTNGALIAMFLCTINPAEIWNVRATLSEPLGQFLILFSIYLVQSFLYKKDFSPMFLIGCILGLSAFNRIDSLIYLPALSFFVVFLSYQDNEKLKKGLSFLYGFLLFCSIGFLYGWIYSRPYLKDLWREKALQKLFILSAVSLLFLAIATIFLKSKRTETLIERIRNFISERKKYFRIGFASFLLFLIIIALFVRPYLSLLESKDSASSPFRAHSLSIFLFYVPALLFLFGINGYDRLLFQKKYLKSSLFVFVGSLLLAVYLYEPSITPDHFWASRRWFLFSIPFSIILGLIGLFFVPIKNIFWKNTVILFVFLTSTYFFYSKANLILFRSMLSGYSEEYERIAKTLPSENSIYFTKSADIASPLRYIYNKRTYLLNNTNLFLSNVKRILRTGADIYLIDSDPNLRFDGLSLERIERIHLQGEYPEERVKQFPESILDRSMRFTVYKLSLNELPTPRTDFTNVSIIANDPSYTSQITYSNKKLKPNDWDRLIMYRNFLPLTPGKYRIVFLGKKLTQSRFSASANDKYTLFPMVEGTGLEESKEIEFINSRADMYDIQIVLYKSQSSETSLSRILITKLE